VTDGDVGSGSWFGTSSIDINMATRSPNCSRTSTQKAQLIVEKMHVLEIHTPYRNPSNTAGPTARIAKTSAPQPDADFIYLAFSIRWARKPASVLARRKYSVSVSCLLTAVGFAERPNDPRRRMACLLHQQEA
jgi:hypothetical protein